MWASVQWTCLSAKYSIHHVSDHQTQGASCPISSFLLCFIFPPTPFYYYYCITLKETNPEYSLEGLMLKLKPQYFGHLMRRADSLEKTLVLGKIEGRRRKGWQKVRSLDGITNSMERTWANSGSWWETGKPGVLHTVHGVVKSRTPLGDWTTNCITYLFVYHAAFLMDWRQPEGRIYLSHHCITSARDNVWHVTNS